jgi:hypothetical protein
MIHAESFRKQPVLRFDHVEITVVREMSTKAIARLARFAVAYSVRQDDEIAGRIQQSACTEEFTGELRPDELCAGPASAMYDEHGIPHDSLRVARFAKRTVMQSKLRQGLAQVKRKFEMTKSPSAGAGYWAAHIAERRISANRKTTLSRQRPRMPRMGTPQELE